ARTSLILQEKIVAHGQQDRNRAGAMPRGPVSSFRLLWEDFQMVTSICNCTLSSPGLSRRDLICGGGAGFVTALTGTLAGSGRTAHAQALTSRVPEVDRLAVTIVTDNQLIKFIQTEKRDGLVIERRPAGNVRPDAPPRFDLVGEWGLSMHAQ